MEAQCLKITEKGSFNIASEASYLDIVSGQKLIKKAKFKIEMRHFGWFSNIVQECKKAEVEDDKRLVSTFFGQFC